MIICEDKKFVFIRNPRVASRSIGINLIKNFNCHEIYPVHRVSIPDQYKNFNIYMFIRNPIERALSFFLSVPRALVAIGGLDKISNNCKYKDFKLLREISFSMFVRNRNLMLPCEVKHENKFMFDEKVFKNERIIEFDKYDFKLKVFNFFLQSDIIKRNPDCQINLMNFNNLEQEAEKKFGIKIKKQNSGLIEAEKLFTSKNVLNFLKDHFERDIDLCQNL